METKPQWGTMSPTDDKISLEAEFAETLIGFNNEVGTLIDEKFYADMNELIRTRSQCKPPGAIKQNNVWVFREPSHPTECRISEPERVANNIPSDYRHK